MKKDNFLGQIIYPVLVIYILYLALQYFTNRTNFWRWVFYGIAVIIAFVGVIFLWRGIRNCLNQRHSNKVLSKLRSAGQEEYLKNFISRFGLEKTNREGWTFRNYKFDWDRINDLKKILKEKEIISKEKDIFRLLKFYIQDKEEQFTRVSIHKEPQKLANLTGVEFEKLLYRLFEAMKYKVELIGKSGDQGGDLIADKDGGRILIQAKCYRDWSTGNFAIQQVVGAMKYYDCSKAMVITTSYFTPQATALAKSNNVELIPREQLQQLLLNFLGESWG